MISKTRISKLHGQYFDILEIQGFNLTAAKRHADWLLWQCSHLAEQKGDGEGDSLSPLSLLLSSWFSFSRL